MWEVREGVLGQRNGMRVGIGSWGTGEERIRERRSGGSCDVKVEDVEESLLSIGRTGN